MPKQLRPLTKFNLENMTDIAQMKPRKVITTETQDSASEDSLASQGDFAYVLSADDERSTARGV